MNKINYTYNLKIIIFSFELIFNYLFINIINYKNII